MTHQIHPRCGGTLLTPLALWRCSLPAGHRGRHRARPLAEGPAEGLHATWSGPGDQVASPPDPTAAALVAEA